MDIIKALQNLLNGMASEEEIELLKRGLASGEISIGGNVNKSVVIIGSGNTMELTSDALDRLNGHSLLGGLDRDLTWEEIALGLERLEAELPRRAPILQSSYQEYARRLRSSLKTSSKSLSELAIKEHVEALAMINSMCMEVLDISFNALCLGEELPEYDAQSPFRGLESFRPDDKDLFFGRDALTRKLMQKIQAHSFLAVLGASGSGKSSLVMAGLIPALHSDYTVFRPGTNPLAALEAAKEKPLIVVDQFEELFTLTRDEPTRKEFIAKLLNASQQTRIVLILRSDFLGEVAAIRPLNEEIENHMENVSPMDKDELRLAMEGQAGHAGLRFEGDLSQQILDSVDGEPGAMPLLQHTLWELWNRRHGRWLRASEYRAFGGVKEAITSTAEKTYGECTKTEQEQIHDIFLRLTRLDDNDEGRDTRKRVPLNDLIPVGRDSASITLLLDKLANVRLIVKTVNEDITEIEVAHEALIRHWERLQSWINDDRENLRQLEGLSDDAHRWDIGGRDNNQINHHGIRLELALALSRNSHYTLNNIEHSYLIACVNEKEKEQRIAKRGRRILAEMSVTIVVIIILIIGWSISKDLKSAHLNATQISIISTQVSVANTEEAKAEELAKVSSGQTLATASQQTRPKSQLSLLFAIEAFRTVANLPHNERLLPEQALRDSLDQIGGMPLIGHEEGINVLAFSPDGHWLATGSDDKTVRLWDMQNPSSAPIVLRGHDGDITALAFSLDGRWLATGSSDATARLWDMHNLSAVSIVLQGHEKSIRTLAFSPDGHWLATGSADSSVRLWNMHDLSSDPIILFGHTTPIYVLSFSPDGHWLATAGFDKTARLWDMRNLSLPSVILRGHEGYISALAFSPDGHWLATGSSDATARLWDMHAPAATPIILRGHTDNISALTFAANSALLVTGSTDNTARLWDLQNPTATPIILSGHQLAIKDLVLSPDGHWLATASWDNTARLWNMQNHSAAPIILRGHEENITTLAFSPDGRWLATGSEDKSARLWDMQNLSVDPVVLRGHEENITALAFSPNGHWLATGSRDNTARLWDMRDPSVSQIVLLGHEEGINVLAFNPDGHWLATGSSDNTVRLWDMQNPSSVPIVLRGHDGDITALAFSLDGRWLATGSDDKTARLWDMDTPSAPPIVLRGHQEGINVLAFSSDGHWLATGSKDKSIQLWNMRDPSRSSIILLGHTGPISTLAFSPDSHWLATGSADASVRLWNMHDLSSDPIILLGHTGPISALAFSPDGHWLATGSSDATAHLWDMHAPAATPIILRGHTGNVSTLTFAANSALLATGSTDNTARLWDLQNPTATPIILYGNDDVSTLAFSPNGHWLATGIGVDHTVRLWNLDNNELIDLACKAVGRNFTKEEWAQYFPTQKYQATCPEWPTAADTTPTP